MVNAECHGPVGADLMPDVIVTQIKELTEKLKVVGGTDALSVEAQRNATFMFFSLLRQTFASKRVLNELRLNDAAFKWIIGEIFSRFNQVDSIPAVTLSGIHGRALRQRNVVLVSEPHAAS